MNTDKMRSMISQPKVLSWLVALFPVLSLLFCMSILAVKPDDAPPQAVSNESPPFIVLLLMMTLLLAKILALVAIVRHWYYGWVYHLLEVNVLLFVFGLIIVINILTTPLSFVGALGITLSLGSLFTVFYLKALWLSKGPKDYYDVSRLTRA
ncbi:MAG: hypothetical protein K6L80_09020 [Agarilytica sp.]